jgi:hypothetical protein
VRREYVFSRRDAGTIVLDEQLPIVQIPHRAEALKVGAITATGAFIASASGCADHAEKTRTPEGRKTHVVFGLFVA